MTIRRLTAACAAACLVSASAVAQERERPNEGLGVALQGGVEGYVGSLAPRIGRGPAWGVLITSQASPRIGLELDYNGATNELLDAAGDARVIRNAGSVDVKYSLSASRLEPYVFGGVGISRSVVRGAAAGFSNDTYGQVPLGAGLNLHLGDFTAGVRLAYGLLFGDEFAPEGATNRAADGDLWRGQVNVGGTF